VTPAELWASCRDGVVPSVVFLVGEERWSIDRSVAAVREAATRGGVAGFNEERFTAGESPIETILAAAQVLPMMAPRRFVLVRGADRWERDAERAEERQERGDKARKPAESPLDLLDAYVKKPSPTTALVVVATKLNGSRRVVKSAKAAGAWIDCAPVKRSEDLALFVRDAAKERGKALDPRATARLVELTGNDLGSLEDAVERVSLFVGDRAAIDVDTVERVVAQLREATVWDVVDALAARDLPRALLSLGDVMEAGEPGLRLLANLASSTRQLIKMDAALRAGEGEAAAAASAGVMPWKARDRARVLRALPPRALARWPVHLAKADVDMKGSKRDDRRVLEEAILAICSE
jgi:DNA polymerase-3 subunit delta